MLRVYLSLMSRFNEAAGFTRRKQLNKDVGIKKALRFNEAAGFTRRKPPRRWDSAGTATRRFNEAAGFTRRKLFSCPYI